MAPTQPPASRGPAPKKLKKLAATPEVRDIMEHLIIVGNYNRHKDWRYSQWSQQQKKANDEKLAIEKKFQES